MRNNAFLKMLAICAITFSFSYAQGQQSRCEMLSKRAKTNGNTLLVIALEGFGQFEEGTAEQLYTYQETGRGTLPVLSGAGADS